MKKLWIEMEDYLKEYVGEFYEIAATSEKILISSSFPDEYAGYERRIALKGAVTKAKASAIDKFEFPHFISLKKYF